MRNNFIRDVYWKQKNLVPICKKKGKKMKNVVINYQHFTVFANLIVNEMGQRKTW